MNIEGLQNALRSGFTTKEEQTQKVCEMLHDEFADLRSLADRAAGSEEAKAAQKTIQTLALLLDGQTGLLKYLVQVCEDAQQHPDN